MQQCTRPALDQPAGKCPHIFGGGKRAAQLLLYTVRLMSFEDVCIFKVVDIGDSASMMQVVPPGEKQFYALRFRHMQMAGVGVTYGGSGYVPYHIYQSEGDESHETIFVFYHETTAKPVLLSVSDPSLRGEAVSYINAVGKMQPAAGAS